MAEVFVHTRTLHQATAVFLLISTLDMCVMFIFSVSSPQFWPIKSTSQELGCPVEHVMRPGGALTDTSHTYINTSCCCLALPQLVSVK